MMNEVESISSQYQYQYQYLFILPLSVSVSVSVEVLSVFLSFFLSFDLYVGSRSTYLPLLPTTVGSKV